MRDNIFDIAVHPDLALPALKLSATMLTIDDAPIVQKLLDRCSDYFEVAEGRPPGPDAALYELTDGPAERIPQDLFCLGLRPEKGELVGIIIVIRHHPLPNQWYLGLFLLDPAWRGRTCGKICFFAFENWVASQGAESILLAVVEPNVRAARFWESVGFKLPRCFPSRVMGLRHHVLIEYEKSLIGG
jgi:GNAT superfamily N-acetyltransferase